MENKYRQNLITHTKLFKNIIKFYQRLSYVHCNSSFELKQSKIKMDYSFCFLEIVIYENDNSLF